MERELDDKEVFTFFFFKHLPSPEYSVISPVASFQLSKNRENLGQRRNTRRHAKQCQDREYAGACFSLFF